MNTQERWHKIKELFNDLLEFPSSEWETKLFEMSQGDTEIISEVKALLATVEEQTDVLEKPVTLSYDINEPLIGRVIKGFRVDAPITTGGQGQIFKATKVTDFDRTVVIKFIRGDRISDQAKDRFQQERQILADLNHPNIATMFDGGVTEEGWPYTIMPFIRGMHIDKYISSENLEKDSIIKILIKVCDAVQAAHRNRIVHQDIKPENIMIDENGEPKLLDFGIAEVVFDREQDGTINPKPVTPQYASPEQLYFKPVSTSMDIYSLGVLMYKIFTGRVPFPFKGETGQDYQDYREKVWNEIISPPSQFQNSIGLEIDCLILKCLDKEPANRYQTIEELKDDLRRIIENKPISCLSGNIAYRTKCFSKRNPFILVSLIIAFIIIMLGSAWIWTERVKQHWAIIFSERARFIENEVAKLHSLPLQNTSEYLLKTHSKIETLRIQVEKADFFGRAPGNYALGRSYLALGDLELAKHHLDEAWNSGFKSPENAYILGNAYIQLYQQEVRALSSFNFLTKKEKIKNLREQYLIPAKDFLNAASQSKDESSDYLKALILFYNEHSIEQNESYNPNIYENSLLHTIKAYESQPWLLEAHWLEAFIYIQRGISATQHDEYAQAMASFRNAETALVKAKEKGPCAVFTYSQLGYLYTLMINLPTSKRNITTESLRAKAIEVYEKALKVKPKDATNLLMLSSFLLHYSTDQPQEKAIEALDKALVNINTAIDNKPDFRRAQRTKGDILVERAFREEESATFKLEMLQQGVNLIESTIDDTQNFFDIFNLGYAYYRLGEITPISDLKSVEHINKSLELFSLALEYKPDSKEALYWKGFAHTKIAELLTLSNLAKGEHLNDAIDIYQDLQQKHPNYSYSYIGLSRASYLMATYFFDTDSDLESIASYIATALDSFADSSTVDPQNYQIFLRRGHLYKLLYLTSLYSGENAGSIWERALAEYESSLENKPNTASIINSIGWLYLALSKHTAYTMSDSNTHLKNAKNFFDEALKVNPTLANAKWGQIETLLLQAHIQYKSRVRIDDTLENVLVLYNELEQLPLTLLDTTLLKPQIYLLYAEQALQRDIAPDDYLDQATDHILKAEELDAPFHQFYHAKLLRLQAVNNLRQKRSASNQFSQGVRLLDDLIERLPWRIEFYAERAMLKLIDAENAHPNARGLLQEARQDMDRVMANPNFAPWYRQDSARINRAIAALN